MIAAKEGQSNIVLIGMPGAGKSTLGVVLAKKLGMDFVDVDLLIQNQAGDTLQNLIDERGAEGFIALENEVLKSINVSDTVIATGGSAIYSDEGIAHLRETGLVVYLRIGLGSLVGHLGNLEERGVVVRDGATLDIRALYDERVPLYERYADVVVDVDGLSISEAVRRLSETVRETVGLQR